MKPEIEKFCPSYLYTLKIDDMFYRLSPQSLTTMSLSQFPHPLRQLRSIISELRQGLQLSGGQGSRRPHLGETQGVRHLLAQYRRNAVTQEQVCRHKEEMEFLADTYNTYLRLVTIFMRS